MATAVPVSAQPVTAAVSSNPTEELERLAGLRAAGMLTEEEFEQAKARVLGIPSAGGEVQMGQPMMQAQPAFGLFGGGRAVPVAQQAV